METKHTPGPWFTKREGFSTVYVEARIGGGFLQEIAACGPTAAGIQQQDANAKLIAAAPDLLEALKIMHQHVLELCFTHGTPLPEASIEKSSDAIKKATE